MKILKYQEGGSMPQGAPQGAQNQPEPAQGQEDPLMQIAQMAAQALQQKDCNAAMSVCEAFLMLMQEAQGGAQGGEQGQPVFKKGGKMVKNKGKLNKLVNNKR